MRKNIVKIFIVVVMLLIVFFCIEAKALDDTEKFCDISTESSELGGGIDSSTPLNFEFPDGTRKKGYLYTASFGDKTAFCVNLNKKRGKSYERIGLIDDVGIYSGSTVKYMYQVYNWYEVNKDNIANARAYAQAAMWVLAESPTDFTKTDEMTKMFIQVAVGAHVEKFVNPINAILRHTCQSCKEKTLGKYTYYRIDEGDEAILMNAFFGDSICSEYTHPTAKSECLKWQASYGDNSEVWMLDFLGDVADRYDNYLQYMNGIVRLRPTYYAYIEPIKDELMRFERDGSFAGWKKDIIEGVDGKGGMLNAEPYDGKLYLWCVSGDDPSKPKSQCFVAPEVNDCPKGCNSKLYDIKEKYNFDTMTDDEKNSNIAYKNELNQLYNEYAKYNYVLLKNYSNPQCKPDGVVEISCEPTYESNDCNFNSYNGGFKITDAKDEHDDMNNSCWLEAGISYNYEEDIVSSDTTLGNKYCPVRCWEELESDFPSAVNNIKAGTFFFWGNGNSSDGLLGSINARRFCQTTKIDYDTFYSDFNSNETAITNAYNSYLAQKQYNEADVKGGTVDCHTSDTTSCNGHNESGCPAGYALKSGTCYNYALHDPTCSSHNGSPGYVPGDGQACIIATTSPTNTFVCDSCPSGYDLIGGTCKKKGKEWGKDHVTGATNNGNVCIANDYSGSKKDYFNNHHNLSTELANRKKTVESLIDTREGLTKAIRSCQSQEYINTSSIYKFVGKVTLNYSDPAGINRNLSSKIDLNYVPNASVTNVPGAITGALNLTCASTPLIDDLSGCYGDTNTSSKNFTLTKYSNFAWDYNGEFSFYYPKEEYFWKVIVENAYAVNEKTYNADYSGMNKVPYVVGYGIPTAFSLIEGYYNISIDVTGFGHNGHFNKVMDKENVSVYNYSCPYKVVNELYGSECNWNCDDVTETCTLSQSSPAYCQNEVKGIDLVYRLIEMPNDVNLATRKKTVFPSIDGDGRNPGDNWSSYIANHQKGFVNITSQKVIYDDEPIYEIELTPTLIGEIREDTLKYREENKDPYTSYTDYNNQKKIICDGDDPVTRTCASEWLTDYINAGIITGQYAKNGTTEERVEHIANLKHQYE